MLVGDTVRFVGWGISLEGKPASIKEVTDCILKKLSEAESRLFEGVLT